MNDKQKKIILKKLTTLRDGSKKIENYNTLVTLIKDVEDIENYDLKNIKYEYHVYTMQGTGKFKIEADDFKVNGSDHLEVYKGDKIIAYFKDWHHIQEMLTSN